METTRKAERTEDTSSVKVEIERLTPRVLDVDCGEVKQSSPRSSPRTSPRHDAQRRRWLSSSVASLMDEPEEEEEEEEGVAEPGLEVITDDEASSDSSREEPEKSRAIVRLPTIPSSDDVTQENASPLARLSANMTGMATFLCSIEALHDDDADTMMVQSSRTLSKHDLRSHNRKGSETDNLQMMLSSGPCGTSTIYDRGADDSNRSSGHQVPPPSSLGRVQCTDIDMGEMRQIIVSDITNLLGTTDGDEWGCAVQDWLTTPRAATPNSPSTTRRRVIRNRCALRNAQAQRVRKLWHKWHSRGEWGLESVPPISPHRSFDDTQCFQERSQPPVEVVDFYYDSDPEVFTSKTGHHQECRPGPIVCNASFGSTGYGPCPKTPKASHRRNFASFDSKSSFDTIKSMNSKPSLVPEVDKFDLWDDNTVKDFVKELTLGNINLTCHPASNAETSEVPVSVQAWFEMGSRLQNTLIQPKFMWRETYQPDITSRKLSESCRAPASIDLLAMTRILKPAELDRDIYPYAKLDHSVTIKVHEGDLHLFEAQSTQERDWFAHGLKLVVARLASMIIVGDNQMFSEYFSPFAHSPVAPLRQQSSKKKRSSAEDDSPPKPFFISTTKKDRDDLWGTAP